VIEGGANNKDVPHIVNPVFYLQNLQPTTKTALFYKGNKAPQLADRECIVPCGGTLGGGSSINFMMYTRAQKADFDSWKTEGWTADEMWPYLKKVINPHRGGRESRS
jgi:alcohol oxidase